jgi:hypothetical protein
MDGPGTGNGLATMPGPLRNEILFSGSDWYALVINYERVAALNDDHVFVVFMRVRSRHRGFTASPKRHLTSIGPIKDVPFNSWDSLAAGGNLVCGTPHEIWKIIHGSSVSVGVSN